MMNRQLFYIGTFTNDFYIVDLNIETEELSIAGIVEAMPRPAYMRISGDGTKLYVANENGEGTGGVSSYDISDVLSPKLLSFVPSKTEGPAHIGYMEQMDGAYVVGAGYFDGFVQAWPVDKAGRLEQPSATVQHTGNGPFAYEHYVSKQNHARAHCAELIPGTNLFVCADLGTDEVYAYRLNHGQLKELNRIKMRIGTGPRHIEVHPSGDILYLIDELDSTVNVLGFNKETGEMTVLQRISALPDSFTGISWASAIHLSSDAAFLYVGNRGYDSIAVLAVCENGRKLKHAGWMTQEICAPREFCFDKDGEHLLVCCVESDAVTLNRVNRMDGELCFASKLNIPKPSFILRVN